jgi:hypothetical protein
VRVVTVALLSSAVPMDLEGYGGKAAHMGKKKVRLIPFERQANHHDHQPMILDQQLAAPAEPWLICGLAAASELLRYCAWRARTRRILGVVDSWCLRRFPPNQMGPLIMFGGRVRTPS